MIYDLIYGGHEFQDELKKIFPTAKIENASDDIHENRISLEVVDIEEADYIKTIMQNGFFGLSFWCQMALYEKRDLIKKVLNEIKLLNNSGVG